MITTGSIATCINHVCENSSRKMHQIKSKNHTLWFTMRLAKALPPPFGDTQGKEKGCHHVMQLRR